MLINNGLRAVAGPRNFISSSQTFVFCKHASTIISTARLLLASNGLGPSKSTSRLHSFEDSLQFLSGTSHQARSIPPKSPNMAAPDREILPDTFVGFHIVQLETFPDADKAYSIKPVHYAISIHKLELGGAFSFQGTVKIDVEVKKPVKEVVLNAYQLEVHSAKIQNKNGHGLSPQGAQWHTY